MSLNPRSWVHLAEGLQPGRRKRVDHDCGPGRTLLIRSEPDGHHAYCFRCNEGGVAKAPAPSLAELAERGRRLRAGDALLHRDDAPGRVLLPVPAVPVVSFSSWPKSAQVWLLKAGLGRAEIARLGAYYHPPSDRVVLPVLDSSGAVVYWQARALDGRQPKYMSPEADKAKVLPRFGSAPFPTLTEDILSAFKVGLVGEGWAVMGTKVSAFALRLLMARNVPVNVWLDPDPAGQRGAMKIIKQLRAYGIETRNIVSKRDPKLHNRDEIKEILGL